MSFNPLARQAMLARQSADAVAANPALADIPTDDYARAAEQQRLARIAERTARVRRAQEEADELAARAERFDAAVEQHAAAEVAEKARITKVQKGLETSRGRLVKAVRAADEALAALFDTAEQHDLAVAESSAELRATGLSSEYCDGDALVEFGTGGHRNGLVLDGRWWVRIDPSGLLRRAVYGCVRAKRGQRAAVEWRHPAVDRLERHSAGLLAGCDLPAAFVPAVPDWQQVLASRPAPEGAPVFMSDDTRERLERQQQLEERNDRFREAKRRQDYAQHRAELVAEKGEDHVVALEERLFGGRPFADEVAV